MRVNSLKRRMVLVHSSVKAVVVVADSVRQQYTSSHVQKFLLKYKGYTLNYLKNEMIGQVNPLLSDFFPLLLKHKWWKTTTYPQVGNCPSSPTAGQACQCMASLLQLVPAGRLSLMCHKYQACFTADSLKCARSNTDWDPESGSCKCLLCVLLILVTSMKFSP